MKLSLIMFGMTFMFSCSDNIEVTKDQSCRDKILIENGMTAYTGTESFCESMLAYEYEEKEYYCIDLCTADMLCNLFDCNNEYIYTKDGTENGEFDYEKFDLISEKIELIGIVGIRQ